MGAYRFHLVGRGEILRDEDGRRFDDPEAMIRAAAEEALEILAHEVRTGHLDLDQRLDVEDESGQIVYSLGFADALSVTCGGQLINRGAALPSRQTQAGFDDIGSADRSAKSRRA